MQLTLLGTGSPIPDPLRAGPATLVRSAGSTILVDCGRGVLMRLAGTGVLPPMLNAVLVTHLHSDHHTDLNDVITTQWVMSAAPSPLRVFGPPGIEEVVDATLRALAADIRYRLAHHADLTEPPGVEVTEVAQADRFDVGSASVRVAATDHRQSSQRSRTGSRTTGVRRSTVVTACRAPGSTSCARAPTRTCRP
jgi:ribonuclease Z